MTMLFTAADSAAPLGKMLWTSPLVAYVGPGLGFGAIAAILGVIFSIFLAVFALFWYPIKRMLGIGKRPKTGTRTAHKSGE